MSNRLGAVLLLLAGCEFIEPQEEHHFFDGGRGGGMQALGGGVEGTGGGDEETGGGAEATGGGVASSVGGGAAGGTAGGVAGVGGGSGGGSTGGGTAGGTSSSGGGSGGSSGGSGGSGGGTPFTSDGGYCAPGYCNITTGFWRGWCVRCQQGGSCPNVRFCDGPAGTGTGTMDTNTTGASPALPASMGQRGSIEFEVFYDTATLETAECCGGKHLMSPQSSAIVRGETLESWTRPDLTSRQGLARICLYNLDEHGQPWFRKPCGNNPDGGCLDAVTECFTYNEDLNAHQRWVRTRVSWDRIAPGTLRVGINASTHDFPVHPLSRPIRFNTFGNMDALDGGVIRFRNIRYLP